MEQDLHTCTICSRSVGTTAKGLVSHMAQSHSILTQRTTNNANLLPNIDNNICMFVNEGNIDNPMVFQSDIHDIITERKNIVNSSQSNLRNQSQSNNNKNREIHRRKRVRTNDKGDDSDYIYGSTSSSKNYDRIQHTQDTNENNYFKLGTGEEESDSDEEEDDDDEEEDDGNEEETDEDEEAEDEDEEEEEEADQGENHDHNEHNENIENNEGLNDAENNNNNSEPHNSNVQNPFETGNVDQPNYEELDTCDKIGFNLLSILNKANCPLYLYEEIVDWSYTSYILQPHLFKDKKLKSRDNLISKLVKKYSLQGCYQEKTEIKLKYCKVDIPVCRVLNPLSAIKSILHQISTYSSTLMNYTNKDNILEMPLKPHEIKEVTELHTGYWYSATFYKMFTNYDYSSNRENVHRNTQHEKAFLLPVIIQLDELCVDSAMKIPMEPVLIGLGLPKRKIRNIPYVWRTLGFIPTLTKIKKT